MKIISRTQARSQGLKRYFTGKACKHGHVSERYVSDGHCVECSVSKARRWSQNNREADRLKSRKYYAQNTQSCLAKSKRWAQENPEKIRLSCISYYQRNKPKFVAKAAKYRASKIVRTPPWADLEAIAKFYEDYPKGYQVDHIIPLQGELISGLHVLNNLQYLTPEQNTSKGNKFPYYPDAT